MAATKALRFGIAVLAIGLLAGCASGASRVAARVGEAGGGSGVAVAVQTQHTVTHTVHTYRADGTLAVPVTRTTSGSCFTATIAAPGADAYRCIAGTNQLLDPCVAKPGASVPAVVACRADPWSAAVVLRLTSALPLRDAAVSGSSRPWALQLTDGTRCVAATGTVPRSHGISLTYRCTDGGGTSTPHAGAHRLMRADHVSGTGTVTHAAKVSNIWRI